MPFQHILQDLVDRTPKAVGAILVDWEGEAVQEFCHCDPYDMRFLAAHQGILLSRLKEIPDSVRGGQIEDVVVTATEGQLMIGSIDQDYALVMSIARDCSVSLATYNFRQAIARLRKEI